MQEETWRETGYPGYRVSSLGRVEGRSGYCLKARPNKDGYLSVTIYYHGFKLTRTVHGLVCRAWHGKPLPSQVHVRHLNGDPNDNRPENLAWGDQSENEYDKVRHGRSGGNKGEKHGSHKLTNEQVLEIRRLYEARVANQRALAAQFGVTQSVISQIITRQLWSHLKNEQLPAKGERNAPDKRSVDSAGKG